MILGMKTVDFPRRYGNNWYYRILTIDNNEAILSDQILCVQKTLINHVLLARKYLY